MAEAWLEAWVLVAELAHLHEEEDRPSKARPEPSVLPVQGDQAAFETRERGKS